MREDLWLDANTPGRLTRRDFREPKDVEAQVYVETPEINTAVQRGGVELGPAEATRYRASVAASALKCDKKHTYGLDAAPSERLAEVQLQVGGARMRASARFLRRRYRRLDRLTLEMTLKMAGVIRSTSSNTHLLTSCMDGWIPRIRQAHDGPSWT